MKKLRNLLFVAAGATAMVFAPLSPGRSMAEPVRVSSACAQATDCDPKPDYICSKAGGDVMESVCSEGCGVAEE